MIGALLLIFTQIAYQLPEIKSEGRELFAVPLVHLFNDPSELTQHIFNVTFQESCADAGLFKELNKRFYENACAASL